MSNTEEQHPHDQWVQCPHCRGKGYEPQGPTLFRMPMVAPGKNKRRLTTDWCTVCLPTQHPSALLVPWKSMTMAWHWDRDQRPGKVRVQDEVVYALDPRRQG